MTDAKWNTLMIKERMRWSYMTLDSLEKRLFKITQPEKLQCFITMACEKQVSYLEGLARKRWKTLFMVSDPVVRGKSSPGRSIKERESLLIQTSRASKREEIRTREEVQRILKEKRAKELRKQIEAKKRDVRAAREEISRKYPGTEALKDFFMKGIRKGANPYIEVRSTKAFATKGKDSLSLSFFKDEEDFKDEEEAKVEKKEKKKRKKCDGDDERFLDF